MSNKVPLKAIDLLPFVRFARVLEDGLVSEDGKYQDTKVYCPPPVQEDPRKQFRAIVSSSPFRLSTWKEHFYATPEQKVVNREVTNRAYDEANVYRTDSWDLVPGHLAFKVLRAGLRFVAPETMEASVATDNPDIEHQVLQEKCKRSQ
ncbi:MAG TPA: hypothetical protein VJR29_00325 [bacterium]|nr:hypothetical protein [bacterium]